MNSIIEMWATNRVKAESYLAIPAYLEKTYWWAYVRPYAVAFWDRQWLVNLILFGNLSRLCDAAIAELTDRVGSRTLQIACVYGDFSVKLAERVAQAGSLDIIDVLRVQLDNVRRKLANLDTVNTLLRDATNLKFADVSYDQVVIFFLLHEVPASVKQKTLSEALRVLKLNGKLVIVDYHRPSLFHPLRYLLPPMLKLLEPFALELWHEGVEQWLPQGFMPQEYTKKTFFGGLYQIISLRKNKE